MTGYVPGLTQHKTKCVLNSLKDWRPLESVIEAKLEAAGILNILYTLKLKFDREKSMQEWFFLTDKQIEEYNIEKNLNLKKASFGIKNISGFQYIEPYSDGLKTTYYYAPVVEV